MDKNVEKKILNHLKSSRETWTDIFNLINLKNGTYSEYGDLLSDMLDEGHIKLKNETTINRFKLTRKGKLVLIPELCAKITKEGEIYVSNLSFFSKIKAAEIVRLIKDIVTIAASLLYTW